VTIDMMILADIIGSLGVAFILLMYFLLQINRISSAQISYSLGNLLGAGMILFSLFFHWNFPAVLMEIAWMLVSVYGLIKACMHKD